jgi:DDE superfamily endonuclease
MDMEFLYILPGWEGSAADNCIFEDARASDFHIPKGHYYLADAGYANLDKLLVPYHGVRYHLKEWASGSHR